MTAQGQRQTIDLFSFGSFLLRSRYFYVLHMGARDCRCLSTHLPAPVALCSPFGCAGVDLSGKQAILKMAAHPSWLSQAVSTAFNLTCNFPGEVCKSHKQNLNAIKCCLQPVNTSYLDEAVLCSNCPEPSRDEKLPSQPTVLCAIHSSNAATTALSFLSNHMYPTGCLDPCTFQGEHEKTVFPCSRASVRLQCPFNQLVLGDLAFQLHSELHVMPL